MSQQSEERAWIIQRCIDAFTNHYENWSGYCENFMTRSEMVSALEECGKKWPDDEFRGHNIHSISERHEFGEYPKPIKR